MHPEIISFGPFAIRAYGFMLAIGFLSGIYLAARRAEKYGENPDHVYNLAVWIIVSSLIGARLYYVMTHYSGFRAPEGVTGIMRIFVEFRSIFWPIDAAGNVGLSGLILYGGLILATITTVGYLRFNKLSPPRFMDILAPSLGIGEFFTRIGCFLNGCCYGTPTDHACGIVFPSESAAGYFYPETPLHPAQLYNAGAGLAIFGVLLLLERYKRFDGFLALWYFTLYSVGRFTIDFSRYYERDSLVLGMSQNQIISIIAFTISTSLLAYFQWRAVQRGDTELHV
jgi:phosphatidylglycerol---prolipoprotein diacylglyceryl transferase